MIEINLLRGFSAEGIDGGDATLSATFATAQKVVFDEKDLALKMALLLVPVILVYFYEFYDEGLGQDSYKAKQRRVSVLTDELSQFGKQVAEVRKIKEEQKRLTSRVDTIKEISKARLSNAKALDALHQVVPEQAWLRKLSITDGKVKIQGEAVEDIIVSRLLRNLDESIYFEKVRLISSEESGGRSGSVKKFTIECELGK